MATFMSVIALLSSTYGRSSIGLPSITPTDTADTASLITLSADLMCPFFSAQRNASTSATYAPVIDAVRVPPSACRTSQSNWIWFSPSAFISMTPRRQRPIRRLISWVRPPILPLTDSRSVRSEVARGSIAYSAVTQPSPLSLRQRGTDGVKVAVHMTRVCPHSMSTEPSGGSVKCRVMRTGRSSLTFRPSARVRFISTSKASRDCASSLVSVSFSFAKSVCVMSASRSFICNYLQCAGPTGVSSFVRSQPSTAQRPHVRDSHRAAPLTASATATSQAGSGQ